MKFIAYIVYTSLVLIASTSEVISKNQSSIDYFRIIIETLASDSMYGREAGSLHEQKAAEFIFQEFSKGEKKKVSYHTFEFVHPDQGIIVKSRNVFTYIHQNASSTIVIGAHYDHIGLGGSKSLSLNKIGQIHNGADDNASGVALMLGLLKNFKQWKQPNYNYLFVAYSAHELGLFGSTAFKEYAEQSFAPISLLINFDMVGRLDVREKVLAIYGSQTLLPEKVVFFNQVYALQLRTNESDLIYQTDANAFAQDGIPCLSFTTGTHIDYHKVSDDPKYINYDGILMIQEVLQSFLSQLKI